MYIVVMRCRTLLFISALYFRVLFCTCDFNPFMDSVYYSIDWSGRDSHISTDDVLSSEDSTGSSVFVTTANKEKYRCSIPPADKSDDNEDEESNAESSFELELLKPLFEQTSCTYRLETYWTYELCHGKHLRQYHEEKEIGKKTKLTEYFLGRYDMSTFWQEYSEAESLKENPAETEVPSNLYKKKKVQGIEIPYFEVIYNDGTTCDLTGMPRRTSVQYVCQPDGHGELYEVKETSTCEYDVIVLTSLLCSHPMYGFKKDEINVIHCYALDGSPLRPNNLDVLENPRERFNSREFWNADYEELDEAELTADSEPQPPLQFDTVDDRQRNRIGQQTDREIIHNFLTGDFCVHGGSGWWKYEFCYGRHVKQYHEDKNTKVVIVLGEWNTASHLLWITNNPKKRPAAIGLRKSIHHFYGNGNVCDATGERRTVEVKMTCVDSPSNRHSMSVYLVEPKTCQYKLVVESPLLCSIINEADFNGLVPVPNE